ncbi:MAG: hypothetical protein M3Q51_00665 [Pseudomonadota bacterium]|nr:hypothetical protein [Pseudomonadota bacterium]MDQ3159516.1 hypothetical protein [Pseudomonadota bacterium]
MTTSADVIAAINQRRTRLTIRPETPGALPTGWQQWLDAMPVSNARAKGTLAHSLVDTIAQRPLRPIPRRPAALSRLESFASLLRQQWQPDLADERSMRIGAGAIDILLHAILIGLLAWLIYLHLMMPAPPLDDSDEAVQVEFIGRGNLAEGGGAIANAGSESGPAAAAPTTRAVTPTPASGSPDASIVAIATPQPPASASSEAPTPVQEVPPPAAVAVAQPVQVSEVRQPAPQAYQLPATKLQELQLPQARLRDVQPVQQVEAIASLKPPPVRTLTPREVEAKVRAPQLRQEVRKIDVPEPQRLATVPSLALPTPATSSVQVPQRRGQVVDIPMPPGGAPVPSAQAGNGVAQQANTAVGAGGARGNAPAAGTTPTGNGQGTQAAVQGARGVASTGTGAGPGSKPAPGGWAGKAKSDDWGASTRNVAGTGTGNGSGSGKGREGDGKPGLLNSDGSVRLSDDWTEQSGIDVDRSGTWLKRPGLEYRGTRFDEYWVPKGTLLEEWVRKGIKQVSIPIPGTRRQLRCVVSMLPPGAICNPYSPDVVEQPARARPPPDIPFKPALQEDNGSVKPASP